MLTKSRGQKVDGRRKPREFTEAMKANLAKGAGGRRGDYLHGQPKRKRNLMLTDDAWTALNQLVVEAGCRSASEFIEQVGRGIIPIVPPTAKAGLEDAADRLELSLREMIAMVAQGELAIVDPAASTKSLEQLTEALKSLHKPNPDLSIPPSAKAGLEDVASQLGLSVKQMLKMIAQGEISLAIEPDDE